MDTVEKTTEQSALRGVTRRTILSVGAAGALLTAASCSTGQAAGPSSRVGAELVDIERATGTTIGLYAENLSSARKITHRHTESFPMCSVFKALAVAALMSEHSPYGDYWDKEISFDTTDLVDYSPITGEAEDGKMTVAELADAALRFSDNTAANLLLQELGGPEAVTRFAREHEAMHTRLDRWEPELNEAVPGDPRDTTTPADIALLYRRILVDDTLGQLGQAKLRDWMLRNTTADERLGAAVDGDHELADKTGSGGYGVVNDVGVIWRPDGSMTVIAVLVRSDDPDADSDPAVLVEAARVALAELL